MVAIMITIIICITVGWLGYLVYKDSCAAQCGRCLHHPINRKDDVIDKRQ